MKKFEEPSVLVLKFAVEEIMTASGCLEDVLCNTDTVCVADYNLPEVPV